MGAWAVGPRSVTGMVLAGGRGRRWGEQDKGLITVDDKPMAQSALQRLQATPHEALAGLAINANRHLPSYAAWGWPVWPDDDPAAFHGPLAGWQTGLRHCPTPWLLSVPCDTPDFPEDLIAQMVQTQGQTGAALVLAASQDAAGRHPHPVFALLHTDLLPSLNAFVHDGGRRVMAWCEAQAPAWTVFDVGPEHDPFANLNSQADAESRRADRFRA